jgi:hypothetical protein
MLTRMRAAQGTGRAQPNFCLRDDLGLKFRNFIG